MKKELKNVSHGILNQAKRFARFIFATVLLTMATLPAFAADVITSVSIKPSFGMSRTYNGAAQMPNVSDLSIVDDESKPITSGVTISVDATGSTSDGTKVGTVFIKVEGDGSSAYTGDATTTNSYEITPFPLSIAPVIPDKVYDKTKDLAISEMPSPSSVAFVEQATLDGWYTGGDVAVDAFTNVTFDDFTVGTHGVTVTYTLSGTDNDNFTVAPYTSTGKIIPRSLAVDASKVNATKEYDGLTTGVVLDFLTDALEPGVSGDNVIIDPVASTGTAIRASVGVNRGVETNIRLKGGAAPNYSVVQPTDVKATITPRKLWVGGIFVENKPYDGTTTATLSGTPILVDRSGNPDPVQAMYDTDVRLINGTVTGADFNDASVDDRKPVTPNGLYELIGVGSDNYDLQQPDNWVANITTAQINFDVEEIADETYTGSAITPSVLVVKDPTSKNQLTSGTDYSVTATANINAGTATVNIIGKGYYGGSSREKTFTILPKPFSGALSKTWDAGSGISGQPYTGAAITPKPTSVTLGGTTLTLNTDYELVYVDNVNIGTATVKIVGKGNYTGEVSQSFAITKATLSPSSTIKEEYKLVAGTGTNINLEALMQEALMPNTYNYGDKVYTVTNISPSNSIIDGVSVNEKVSSSMPVKIKRTANVNQTATIVVTVESTNYENFIINIPVKVVTAPSVTISGVEMEGGEYNGNAYAMVGTPIFKLDNGTVIPPDGEETFVYTMANGAPITTPQDADGAPIYAGSYKLTITPPIGYSCSGGVYPFAITQKPLTVTLKDITIRQGDALPTEKVGRTYVSLAGDYDEAEVRYEGFVNPADTTGLSAGAKARVTLSNTNTIGAYNIDFQTSPTLKPSGIGTNYIIPTANRISGKLYITKYEVPGAPTGVTATPGSGRAIVTFTAPANDGIGDYNGVTTEVDDITSYRVKSTPDGIEAYGTSSPITIKGLTNEESYTFKVEAMNDKGWGAASKASPAVRPSASLVTPPSKIAIVVAGTGVEQASVMFSEPVDDGGSEIIRYTVTVNPGGTTVTDVASPITVTGLTAGTDYTFTVTATNADGLTSDASEPSNVITPVPPKAPAPPTISATAGDVQGTVEVKFSPNNEDKAVINYTISVDPVGITITGTASPITITDLFPGTYTFKVTVNYEDGTKMISTISPSVTIDDAAAGGGKPAPPSNVSVTPGQEGTAKVTFTPNNRGRKIISYTVVSTPSIDTAPFTATGTASPITVENLPPDTYEFRVKVNFANGESMTSAAITAAVTSGDAIPLPPYNVKAKVGNVQGTAKVEFTPNNAGKEITGYTVESTPGDITAIDTTEMKSPITITDLPSGTYTFKVTVNFADGTRMTSLASPPVTMNGGAAPPSNVNAIPGDAHATVMFTPNNAGREITGYTVMSDPDGITETGTGSPITVYGLTNGTEYTFNVTVTFTDGLEMTSAFSSPVIPSASTGIDDVEEAAEVAALKMYPNPATDIVTITGLQGDETIRFYDAGGRAVLTRQANASEEVITVSQLQKGIYIVRIGTKALKLVKK